MWFDIIKRGVGVSDKVLCGVIEHLQKNMPERELEGKELYINFRNAIEEIGLEQIEEVKRGQRIEGDVWMRKRHITALIGGNRAYATIIKQLIKSEKINFPYENTTRNSIIIPNKNEWSNPYAK